MTIQNIKNKIKYLENNAKMSEENYNSLEKLFITTNTNLQFKQDNKSLPIIPDTLNKDLKLLYKIIGNANREITIKNWIVISLNKALYIYKQKKLKNQCNVFDFAYQYSNMEGIKILSCDLLTSKLFYRNEEINNNRDKQLHNNYKFIEFNEWFDNLDKS